MTPAAARAMYARQIGRHGETISVKRKAVAPAADTVVRVRARVTGYAPDELVAGIEQGDRKVIVLAEDLEESGFPLPLKPRSTDRLVIRGRDMMVSEVDDSTRRLGTTLIAYEIRATG